MISRRPSLSLPGREITDHVERLVGVVQALDLEEVGPVPDGNDLVVSGLHRVRGRAKSRVYVAAFKKI